MYIWILPIECLLNHKIYENIHFSLGQDCNQWKTISAGQLNPTESCKKVTKVDWNDMISQDQGFCFVSFMPHLRLEMQRCD